MMTDDAEYGGPWLQAAVFCEKLLQEQDGVVSLIRVIDRFMIQASGPEPPERMPAARLSMMGYLAFKSGIARGSYSVTIKGVSPLGRPLPGMTLPMLLEGEDRGAGLGFQLNLDAQEEGLYWFEVLIGERLITRMPLRVVYQRTILRQGPS